MITILLAISRYAQTTSATRFLHLIQDENVVITHAYIAKIDLLEARRNEKELLYATDDTLVISANKFIAQFQGELETVNSMVLKTADPRLIDITPKLLSLCEAYQKNFQAMVSTPPGQLRMIAALSVRKTATSMETNLKDLLDGVNNRIEKETLSTQKYITTIGTVALLAGIITMLIGGLLAFYLPRAITRPLNLMQKIITEVETTHDLTRRIPLNSQDEVGKTADAFNRLMAGMQSALGNILRSVGEVSEASQILSSSSNHVAMSSAQQNEAASAMASSVDGVAVSIKQVSVSAHQAQEISSKSGVLSKQGGAIIDETTAEMLKIADAVRQTSTAIENLSHQSSQISSVVKVIKELADQTNLLALNAAIEAARAGEQGRGFAVVADEVRKLAESTTRSTEEIRSVVEAIQSTTNSAVDSMGTTVTQVNAGVERAKQAGDSIRQIREGADQVIKVINDITSALVAQANASNEIAANVERVTHMTEENKGSTEETASEADHLKRLAETMRISVNQFKI